VTIKVGIIGFGMSAQTFHLPLLSAIPDFAVNAFCSSQSQAIASLWPNAQCVATVEDLVAVDDIDLVVITSPSGLHFEHAKCALMANKHVVAEKPFALNSCDAIALFDLAKQRRRVITAFHNRRWDGDFLTVRKLLSNKTLGQVRYFESHFDRFRPVVRERWREQEGAGNGILYDLGPHLIDQALCLFGMPRRVSATIRKQRQNAQVDDYVHIQMHYENLEVVLHADMLNASPNLRFKVQGDKGTYIKQGLDPQENQLKQGMSPLDSEFGMTVSSEHGHIFSEADNDMMPTQQGSYARFYHQLALAVRGEQTACVDEDSIVQVMRIIDLVIAANEQGRGVSVTNMAT
jgi:predicted dehydrogenase